MKRGVKMSLVGGAGVLGLALITVAITFGPIVYRSAIGLHRYETVAPILPAQFDGPAILVFSKTNGFRHEEAIPAANRAFSGIAKSRGWSVFLTEDAGIFNAEQLGRFKAVVWNNTSGDVLTSAQRTAFKAYLEAGGGFVGIHAAGGDPKYAWRWYVDDLIGAQFIGHTLSPQYQEATIRIEDNTSPATKGLGSSWVRTDEWYSFESSPRAKRYHILANLDESSYSPFMTFPLLKPRDIHMGDHPIIWSHCVVNGRAFYSALGHLASAYEEPKYLQLLEGATAWAAGLEGSRCAEGDESTE
jgi:type 1 glutamine amidotransferase